MDTVCYKKWVQDTISCPSHIITGSSSILKSDYLRSREDSTSERGSGIHAGQTCHRTSHFVPSEEWLLQPAISGSQELGRMETSIDRSRLKRHIITSHLKMETLDSVRLALRKNDWAISLDLKDAYFHIPIHRKSRRYLPFPFMGKTYQFRALSFGLFPALYAFSIVLKAVIKHCRRMGMRLHAYLDDWLQPSRSQVISLYHREQLLRTVLTLGFVPNPFWELASI